MHVRPCIRRAAKAGKHAGQSIWTAFGDVGLFELSGFVVVGGSVVDDDDEPVHLLFTHTRARVVLKMHKYIRLFVFTDL